MPAEAFVGGMIGLLKDGDEIEIDAEKSISVNLSDEKKKESLNGSQDSNFESGTL